MFEVTQWRPLNDWPEVQALFDENGGLFTIFTIGLDDTYFKKKFPQLSELNLNQIMSLAKEKRNPSTQKVS